MTTQTDSLVYRAVAATDDIETLMFGALEAINKAMELGQEHGFPARTSWGQLAVLSGALDTAANFLS